MSSHAGTAAALLGQDGGDGREDVRLQRELKRKKNILRKLEVKTKSLKSTADANAVAAAVAESETLKAEIAQLERGLNACLSRHTPAGDNSSHTRLVGRGRPQSSSSKKTTSGEVVAGARGKARANNVANTGDGRGAKGVVFKSEKKQLTTPVESQATDALLSDEALYEELAQMVKKNIESDTDVLLFPSTPFQPYNSSELVHYHVAELALMIESMLIVGGNARALAMIEAFKSLLQSTPVLSGPSLSKVNPQDFEQLINVNFDYLRRSREPTAGMTYVKEGLIRSFVRKLTIRDERQAAPDDCLGAFRMSEQGGSVDSVRNSIGGHHEGGSSDDTPRKVALNVLAFYERELKLSIESILEERSLTFLSSNDTILVFGRSSTVELILLLAARRAELVVKPKVIVVDSAPLYEGRALAKRLTCSGLSVTYGLITTCCTLMPRCTRVFIGASAVLQNGDVLNRCGTALVVASAKQYRKPVLCFSASFKFLPEVWLGNLVQNTQCIDIRQPLQGEHNRICSPGVRSPSCNQSRDVDKQQPGRGKEFPGICSGTISAFGYLYDITPAAYVDMIICEMGCLHTSAIVAALRDREDKDEYSDMWETRCDVGE